MPWLTRSDFTAADGSAWPLTPGAWTHVTESGSLTATETVLSNAGRHAATVGAVSYRRHHAETTIARQHVECRARAARVGGVANVNAGIMVRSDGGNNYLLVNVGILGKVLASGVQLEQVANGSHTVLRSSGSVTALHTTGFVWIGVRMWQVDGFVVVTAKTWLTTEPDWLAPGTLSNGAGGTDTGTDWARLWHVIAAPAVAGSCGLVSQWFSATTGPGVDYDDWSAHEIFVLPRVTTTATALDVALIRQVPTIAYGLGATIGKSGPPSSERTGSTSLGHGGLARAVAEGLRAGAGWAGLAGVPRAASFISRVAGAAFPLGTTGQAPGLGDRRPAGRLGTGGILVGIGARLRETIARAVSGLTGLAPGLGDRQPAGQLRTGGGILVGVGSSLHAVAASIRVGATGLAAVASTLRMSAASLTGAAVGFVTAMGQATRSALLAVGAVVRKSVRLRWAVGRSRSRWTGGPRYGP